MQVEYVESEKVWKAPQVPIPQTGLGATILERLLKKDPNWVMEVYCDKEIELRVKDILEQTIVATRIFKDHGIGKGDVVVLYSLSNEWLTPLTFACYMIGAPVHFVETKFEGEHITRTFELVQPSAILYESVFRDRIFAALERIKYPKLKMTLSIDKELDLSGAVDIDAFQLPDIGDPTKLAATLMLTSGTTGFPKIVQVSHSMIFEAMQVHWNKPPSRGFCFSPPRWISQTLMMLHPLFSGLQRFYTSSPPSGALGKQIIDKYKITFTFSGPNIYPNILRAAVESNDPSSLSSLEQVTVGGDIVNNSLIEFSMRVAPKCEVFKCYGTTEVGGVIALNTDTGKFRANGGILLPNYVAKILDDDNNHVGPNEMGRLFVKLPFPSLGYLKNDKENRETFLEGDWYYTGDYAFMDSDCMLTVVSRYTYLIRSGNTVMVPNRAENVVNNIPGVVISALVGHPDKGDDVNQIGTLFVDLGGKPLEDFENNIRELLKSALRKEELEVVKYIRAIPKMLTVSSGKVDRVSLKNLALDAIQETK